MDEVDCFSYMFSQLHDFMKKGVFTDVIFVVGNTTVKAHKVVLSSCSSVFRTMFESSEEPSSQSSWCFPKRIVDSDSYSHVQIIKDFDDECFIAFLDYLYCRDVKIVETRAQEMMRLAYQYKVKHLLPLCDSFVEGSLNNENAVECLLLAHQCERSDLKKIVKSYIKSQMENIMASKSWSLLDNKFELTTEIIEWDAKDYYVKRNHMDEVTWTICNDGWKDEKKEDIMDTRGVIVISPVISGEPKVDVFLSFHYRNHSLVVVGYADYCLRQPVHLTFVATVTNLKNSRVLMEKKVHMEWRPTEVDGTEIMALSESLDFHFQYPLTLRVCVKKTPVISQHPCIRGFNFYEMRNRFTDVAVLADGAKFHLHKLVLTSKSDYFVKLFESDAAEYRFDNIDACTFKRLVDYIYSCVFPPPSVVDIRLLEGAWRYKLKELCEYCITILIINLSVSNVVDTCIIADMMCLDQLKSSAVEFIANNRERVVKSIDWNKMKDHPHLLKEVLSKISLNERDELDTSYCY